MIADMTDTHPLLAQLSEAYSHGDAPLGEVLLLEALDQGVPWDRVATAVAHGTTSRYGGRATEDAERG